MTHRWLLLLSLTGCLEQSDVPRVDGWSSSRDLWVDAQARYTRCDGQPCTTIEVELRRVDDVGNSVYAAETSVVVAADGQPGTTATFVPQPPTENAGEHRAVFPGWIGSLRVDAIAGSDTAVLESASILTTPDETDGALPATVELGRTATLTWEAQDPALATIAYSTLSPAPRLGFIQVLRADEGRAELSTEVLSTAGLYNVALEREISHEGTDDHRLYVRWASRWDGALFVTAP